MAITNLGFYTPNLPGGPTSPSGALPIPIGNTVPLLNPRPFIDPTYTLDQTEFYDKSVVDVSVSVVDNFVSLMAALDATVNGILADFEVDNTVEGYYEINGAGFDVNNFYDQAAVISYRLQFTVYVKIT